MKKLILPVLFLSFTSQQATQNTYLFKIAIGTFAGALGTTFFTRHAINKQLDHQYAAYALKKFTGELNIDNITNGAKDAPHNMTFQQYVKEEGGKLSTNSSALLPMFQTVKNHMAKSYQRRSPLPGYDL